MVVAQSKKDPSQKFVLSESPSDFDASDFRLEWVSKESAENGDCLTPFIAHSPTKTHIETIMATPKSLSSYGFERKWRNFLASNQDKVIQFKEMELKF